MAPDGEPHVCYVQYEVLIVTIQSYETIRCKIVGIHLLEVVVLLAQPVDFPPQP